MNRRVISDAVTDINPAYVEQAADYRPTSHKLKHTRVIIALVAAIILTASAFAAERLFGASDVAALVGKTTLAEYFESGEGEAFNVESQTSWGYTITLLGVATGDDLASYSEDVDLSKSYIVASIEKSDGEPITNYVDVDISPLISGYDPEKVNRFTLSKYNEEWLLIEDGVEYILLETSNISIFADHTVYIAIYSSGIINIPIGYHLNEDGTISKNEGYKGIQTLFEVPLDESLADPEAAEAIISKIYR